MPYLLHIVILKLSQAGFISVFVRKTQRKKIDELQWFSFSLM